MIHKRVLYGACTVESHFLWSREWETLDGGFGCGILCVGIFVLNLCSIWICNGDHTVACALWVCSAQPEIGSNKIKIRNRNLRLQVNVSLKSCPNASQIPKGVRFVVFRFVVSCRFGAEQQRFDVSHSVVVVVRWRWWAPKRRKVKFDWFPYGAIMDWLCMCDAINGLFNFVRRFG